ncbi:hypothetical protein Q4E93_09110 [Flavitalea sp. BT771]|uniref:hypothetical protein n=1 Tax=Flavitalea sp. BT771 TaxID=3063329 RepID=UPI0026E1FA7F|nr:hypothetical protein [Flavitalea sp. BT771]MDO6430746.1 hypothetical protein [Flavitalea sp. BT771]MDV6219114.1 hypothetical protein [Flavitalea sp. BT771]
MKRHTALFLLLASWTMSVPAQETAPASFKKDLDQYTAQRLEEKLYIHTDKEFYMAGEICWFKLYVVDASGHHPLDLSKVAYLEWLDRNNKPVLQTKIGLHKGHGNGSLFLPFTLRSGNYKLRGYTSWMKNFGEDWFFEKTITVVNARKSAEIPAAPIPLKYEVVFFPEGGHLVENISSKVAFRISDQYGRGIECPGVVTEDDQDTVARFLPLKFGIGSFMLTPRPGHRYRSTIRLPDGTAVSNLLPSAAKEGMVMTVSDEGNDHIRVNVQSTAASSDIYLIAHTRQSVKAAEAATLKEGKAGFLLDRSILGDGISHLTLFNTAREPMCERLIFKAPSHLLHIDVSTDKDTYATRQKISVQVSTTGEDKKLLPADGSLSVFRLDSLQAAPQADIAAYLYLTSDLKGRIESPDYYFRHPEDKQAADNLMLSHGWRRFRWDEVVHHAVPDFKFPPEYNGAIISGAVVDTRTGAKVEAVQAYLSVPGTRTQFTSAYSTKEGQVKFEMKDFYGGEEIIVQTNSAEDSMSRIDIDNPFMEKYTDAPLLPFTLSPGNAMALTDNSVASQVVNKYYGGRLKQLHFPTVDTTTFFFNPDHTYLLDDYTRFTTMEEVMREYVTLMLVRRRNDHFHLPLFDLPNNRFFDGDPLILVDGVPVFDIDKLLALDPLRMRKLETVQRRYFMGGTFFDGVMNWITYKGDLGGYTLDPHATVVDYEGLQLEREFYSPSYAEGQAPESHLPDARNVLYWSPALPMDASGKGKLDFYASDLPGKYVVVVEGLAADGSAGSRVLSFEVK